MNIFEINGSDRTSNMEGAKRLQFTTVGPPGKQDKKIATPKTHRFELDITDSTDTTCPEFFYTELLKTLPVSVKMSLFTALMIILTFATKK